VNILVLGPQGCGKGTQAQRIKAVYGIPHIATGDMLRAEIANGTPLGLKAQPILAAGQYVSDDIMIGMIRNRLRQPDCEPGFIIDGFGPDGVSARVLDVTRNVVKIQTGYLYHYAFAMLIGVAGLITWFMFMGGQ